MSQRRNPAARLQAPVFAALGDPIRLQLLDRLSSGEPISISALAQGSQVTRQAVTKHLRVLEDVSLVRSTRQGRCTLFTFTPEPIIGLREFLDLVARHWDERLGRLKSLVEAPDGET